MLLRVYKNQDFLCVHFERFRVYCFFIIMDRIIYKELSKWGKFLEYDFLQKNESGLSYKNLVWRHSPSRTTNFPAWSKFMSSHQKLKLCCLPSKLYVFIVFFLHSTSLPSYLSSTPHQFFDPRLAAGKVRPHEPLIFSRDNRDSSWNFWHGEEKTKSSRAEL